MTQSMNNSNDDNYGRHCKAKGNKYLNSYAVIAFVICAFVIKLAIDYSGYGLTDILASTSPPSSSSSIVITTTNGDKKKELTLIQNRYIAIHDDYIRAMNDVHSWKILRQYNDIVIETSNDNGNATWPLFIKTTAIIHNKPSDLYDIFRWTNFDATQRAIDPFYESSSSVRLYDNNNHQHTTRLIYKTTKRPLFYPKRLFTLSALDRVEKKDIVVSKSINGLKTKLPATSNSNSKSNKATNRETYIIPAGTLVSSLINVNIKDDKPIYKLDQYVHAYQDFVAWFLPNDDDAASTKLMIVMKVDLGADIPRWAFLATVAATGVNSMQKMKKLAAKL